MTTAARLKSIEAVDDKTVKFTLCQPDVAFPSKVAFTAFQIQSKAYLQKTGGGGESHSTASGHRPVHGGQVAEG